MHLDRDIATYAKVNRLSAPGRNERDGSAYGLTQEGSCQQFRTKPTKVEVGEVQLDSPPLQAQVQMRTYVRSEGTRSTRADWG